MEQHIWTHEEVFKVLDLFKERELLWNDKSNDYRNRKKKILAWDEMAQAMNMDARVVEGKVKRLIGQYQREIRRSKERDEASKWFAFRKMMFLKSRDEAEFTRGGVLKVILIYLLFSIILFRIIIVIVHPIFFPTPRGTGLLPNIGKAFFYYPYIILKINAAS